MAALFGLAGLSACSAPALEPEPVAELSQALNACEETVPTSRFIDGLPAYAQCASTTSSAIWSNNGVDTSTTSQGTGWVRTQRSGGYQCTEWAWRYMHFKWGIDYQNGNAGGWCDGNLPASLVKAATPVHGDLIVFAPGVCGSDGTTGHIAVIDTVNAAAGTVTFVEENQAGRRSAKQTCATCFLHAVANDGSTSAGTGGGGGLGGATAAGGSAATGGAASGGRSASGGSSVGGALAGGGPTAAGGPSSGGSPGVAGAGSGGSSLSTGGIPGSGGTVSNTGGVASGGTTTLNGGTTATGGVMGAPTATGGAPLVGGSPGVGTGGAPGASGTPGQPSAGTPSNGLDALSSESPGCGVARGSRQAAPSSWFSPFALALAGFALRRRSERRRG